MAASGRGPPNSLDSPLESGFEPPVPLSRKGLPGVAEWGSRNDRWSLQFAWPPTTRNPSVRDSPTSVVKDKPRAPNSLAGFGEALVSERWLADPPRTVHPKPEVFEVEIDDRGRVEGQQLADKQSADDRDP